MIKLMHERRVITMTNGERIIDTILNSCQESGLSSEQWTDSGGAYHDSGWNDSWPDGWTDSHGK